MSAMNAYDTYRTNHFEGMDPKNLILKLYDGALKHVQLAREGIEEQNIRKRGENIGKVIAIVAELNACLDPKYQDESIQFLRGLYAAILTELPKVSITNDITILKRTETYIAELRKIWKNNVMGSMGATAEEKSPMREADSTASRVKIPAGYGANGAPYRSQSFSV